MYFFLLIFFIKTYYDLKLFISYICAKTLEI